LQEEAPLYKQVSKSNPLSRVGEFERPTKGFGSRYMNKFGFEKGKGLGRNEQGIHKPSHMSRTTRPMP